MTSFEVGQDFRYSTESIASTAVEYRTAAGVRLELAKIHNPRYRQCYAAEVRATLAQRLPAGASVSKATMKIGPALSGMARNVAAIGRGAITRAAQGRTATEDTEVAVVTGPRLVAQVVLNSRTTPFPPSLAERLITAVAQRAARVS